MHPYAKTLKPFSTASGRTLKAWSLPALARQHPNVKRLPHAMRIVLESVLRHCDGQRITDGFHPAVHALLDRGAQVDDGDPARRLRRVPDGEPEPDGPPEPVTPP